MHSFTYLFDHPPSSPKYASNPSRPSNSTAIHSNTSYYKNAPVARRLARAKLILTYDPCWSGGLLRSPVVWLVGGGSIRIMRPVGSLSFQRFSQWIGSVGQSTRSPTREHAATPLQVARGRRWAVATATGAATTIIRRRGGRQKTSAGAGAQPGVAAAACG